MQITDSTTPPSIPPRSITDVAGVEVGHWTDLDARTGVTVVSFPADNMAAGEIRGGYPAEREFASLASSMTSGSAEAIVFSGGSVRGLAAADGVVEGLCADERGALMPSNVYLPMVPGAVVYDLAVGDPHAYPQREQGLAAYKARSSEPTALGRVGAGTGSTVAKWRGPANTVDAGIGSWSVKVGDATVGVLVVVNAVGDVFSAEGDSLTGGAPVPDLFPVEEFGPKQNTTLAAVATDARLSRSQLLRVLVRVHDAYGLCLRPAHTRWDGDAALAVSCGNVDVHLDAVGEAAFIATARALESVFRTPAG